jgi:hypothetical protein
LTAFFALFGNDSSGETSTASIKAEKPDAVLGHYQHKRENKMKHRCKELGELAGQHAGWLRGHTRQLCGAPGKTCKERQWDCNQSKKKAADESEKLTF